MTHAGDSYTPFAWPPRPPLPSVKIADTEPSLPPPQPGLARRCASALLAALHSAEDYWLAPAAKPLDRRAADAGWLPDAPGSFCDRCAETAGPHEAYEFGCASCRNQRLPWDRCVRLGAYQDPLGLWIREVKFTKWRALGIELGRLLGKQLMRAGISGCSPNGRLAIVPSPTSLRRRMTRGVDHATALAEGVAAELRAPVVHALATRHRVSQRSLSPTERARSPVGTIRRNPGVDFSGWTVVVVDDVRTTGATLREACFALRSPAQTTRARATARRTAASTCPEQIWVAVAAVASQRPRSA